MNAYLFDAAPHGLADDEVETIEAAMGRGYLVADGQRVAVLVAFRTRCRAAGRPTVFILAGKVFCEGASTRAVEGLALELAGCKVITRQGRLVISGGDVEQVAWSIAGLIHGGRS